MLLEAALSAVQFREAELVTSMRAFALSLLVQDTQAFPLSVPDAVRVRKLLELPGHASLAMPPPRYK